MLQESHKPAVKSLWPLADAKQVLAVQVGKAWLFLSQLYKTNPSPASQQMAEAALVRSWEIYALCQVSATCEVRM